MNKTFDLHRFGMVLRWDLLTNWKSYLCSIAGLAIGIIMLSIPMRYSFPSSRVVEQESGNYYEGSMTDSLPLFYIAFFGSISCLQHLQQYEDQAAT